MIIHLHSDSVPFHFMQIEHIIKCIIISLPKLSSLICYEGLFRGTLNLKVDIHIDR
jgi:hypothetical protein